jgi:hypothetical protein
MQVPTCQNESLPYIHVLSGLLKYELPYELRNLVYDRPASNIPCRCVKKLSEITHK